MSVEGYKATIVESSWEMSKFERVAYKSIDDCKQLDEVSEDGLEIKVCNYYILDIHNEMSDNKDYTKIILIDELGDKYITGSQTFINSFLAIYEELKDEDFMIKVFKRDSNNYKGKKFITCSVVI